MGVGLRLSLALRDEGVVLVIEVLQRIETGEWTLTAGPRQNPNRLVRSARIHSKLVQKVHKKKGRGKVQTELRN